MRVLPPHPALALTVLMEVGLLAYVLPRHLERSDEPQAKPMPEGRACQDIADSGNGVVNALCAGFSPKLRMTRFEYREWINWNAYLGRSGPQTIIYR